MSYFVKEIFYSLQGEGNNTGRPAVFCRFFGCNLWSGLEEDRLNSVCKFCDTDFRKTNENGGCVFESSEELAYAIIQYWPHYDVRKQTPFVVLTGGEPLIQVDQNLVDALKKEGIEIALETNGTLDSPDGIDWICVSPKSGTNLKVRKGNELKLVFPQEGLSTHEYEKLDFQHFYIQPMHNDDLLQNTRLAVDFCLENPRWKLSLQTHKILNIK